MKLYKSWAYTPSHYEKASKVAGGSGFVFVYNQIQFLLWLYSRIEARKPYNRHMGRYEKLFKSEPHRLSGDVFKDGKFFASKATCLANIHRSFGKLEELYPRELLFNQP